MLSLKRAVGLGLFAVAASGASACTAAPAEPLLDEPAAVEDHTAVESADDVFTQTSVTRNEDGTTTVTTSKVTRAQQIAAREAEERRQAARARGEVVLETRALTQDGSCLSTSLRLFDQTNYTGNVLCFSGDTSTSGDYSGDLAAYVRNFVCSGTIATYWYDVNYTGCIPGFSSSHKVRSLQAGQYAGALANGYYSCSSSCVSWAANDSISSVSSGNCRYAFRGTRWPC